MSLIHNLGQYLPLSPDQIKSLIKDLAKELESSSNPSIPNKLVVSKLRLLLKENFNLSLPQQRTYELLSSLMGYKNYNIALTKGAQFSSLFLVSLPLIPTGFSALDLELRGGLPRGKVSCIFGGANVGKSLFSISVGSNALRSNNNLKVLHINLEAIKDQAEIRYLSNLSNTPYAEIANKNESSMIVKQLNQEFTTTRLRIHNIFNFSATVEDVFDYCQGIYKEFKFDLIILDSAQLLESKKTTNYKDNILKVFEHLTYIAQEFQCAIFTPMQLLPRALKERGEILNSSSSIDYYGIKDLIGVNVTIEKNNNELKIFLESIGVQDKNKLYTVNPNYANSNLLPY